MVDMTGNGSDGAEPVASGRRFHRARLDLYLNRIIGDEPYLARARDISVGGIYLFKLIEPHMAPTDEVGLELKLPDSDEIIWATGQVVREEERHGTPGIALRFVRLAEQHRRLIHDYVEIQRGARSLRRPLI